MRNILLWDKILTQLHTGSFGPAPTYSQNLAEVFASAAVDELGPEGMFSYANDAFEDLNVSWMECEHNLTLMAGDGIITADFAHREIRNVRLTEKGRQMFAMRDEEQRFSAPNQHVMKQASSVLSRIGFPLVAAGVVIWMVLDAI